MNQCQRVLRHIKDFGSITPMEALSDYGIMRLASRISDLRSRGVAIDTELIHGFNRYGEKTKWAKYTFSKEFYGKGICDTRQTSGNE